MPGNGAAALGQAGGPPEARRTSRAGPGWRPRAGSADAHPGNAGRPADGKAAQLTADVRPAAGVPGPAQSRHRRRHRAGHRQHGIGAPGTVPGGRRHRSLYLHSRSSGPLAHHRPALCHVHAILPGRVRPGYASSALPSASCRRCAAIFWPPGGALLRFFDQRTTGGCEPAHQRHRRGQPGPFRASSSSSPAPSHW